MKDIINFSTKFESLEKVNPLITKYRINICQPDKPANKYVFSKSVIEGMSNTVKGSGVYAYYFEKEQQLGGHEGDVVRTSNGYKRTGTPVAYGFADPYEEPYWMEKDGEQWFTTNCYLWTGRNPEIEEALSNPVWHSMEVAVDEENLIDGTKKVTEAIFLGFCLLQGIQPAFTGSTIEKFSLPVEDLDVLKQEFSNISKENEEGDKVIKEAIEKFSLNSEQIREILRNGLSEHKYKSGDYEYCKYYVDSYDAEFVYVYDCEDGKTYSLKYSITDLVATIDVETKIEVIHGGFIPVGQKTEETMAKEDCENKEDMSSNEYVDNEAMNNLNDKSAEDNKELVNENKDKVIASLKTELSTTQEKMSQIEKDNSNLIEENSKLKEFKASIEKQNKDFEIESTLSEVSNSLPKDEIEAFKLSAENFTLENIDVWKNEVKAKAYNFSKGIPEKKSFIKVGLPVSDKPKRSSRLWDD